MKWTTHLPIAILVAGCIEYNPSDDPAEIVTPNPRKLAVVEQEDKLVQVQLPEVDVLYIVDNSCSMAEEQANAAAAFPNFMQYFLGSGLDYHIGVVSTDMVDTTQSGKLRAVQGYRYIDDETTSPEEVFAEMALMGTSGHWDEKGREAAYVALEKRADAFNAGFKRAEASLHMVVIADESDISNQISVSEFVQWARTEKWSEDMVTFSSIVSDIPVCEGAQSAGDDYIAITEAIGGIFWSICNEDWNEVMELLGIQASGLKREYFLSRLPVPETIKVSVVEDGVTFVFKPEIDWVYDPQRNSIIFNEYIPSPMAEVRVKYDVLSSLDVGDI